MTPRKPKETASERSAGGKPKKDDPKEGSPNRGDGPGKSAKKSGGASGKSTPKKNTTKKSTKKRKSTPGKTPSESKSAKKAPPEAAPVETTQPPPREGDVPETGTAERIVVFMVEGQRYALPIESVQEIQQIAAMSEVPDASAAVMGVINLRGLIVPALDLRSLVGMPARPYGLQTPMVFTRTARGLVALVVDEVEDVVEVPAGSMQPASGVYELAERLSGVCRLESGLVFVFDVDALVPPALSEVGRS